MDYVDSYHYLTKSEDTFKVNKMFSTKVIPEKKNDGDDNDGWVEVKKKKKNFNNNNEKKNDNDLNERIYQIISNQPGNWEIEKENSDFNLNQYKELRKKLMHHAKTAWNCGRPQDAKIIMAKANRYNIEINNLINKKKISNFYQNNNNNYKKKLY